MKKLSDLEINENALVVGILPGSKLKRRLQDIGLVDGTAVRCLHQGSSGDPKAFYIRGAVIALRNEDSDDVQVE